MQQQVIEQAAPGWKVWGSDDREIGAVSELDAGYFVMSKGLVFSKSLYVPYQYVDHEDLDHDRVYLRVRKDVVDTMGWDTPPGVGDDADAGAVDTGSGTGDDAWRMPH